MFIESLKIENFKGFHGTHQINLNIPDGTTPGSGLNIFVGENNSGKSTIFEALDFIKDNTKKSPSSLLSRSNPGQELTDFSIEVVYKGQISEVIEAHIQTNKQRTFSDCLFQINGEEGFKVKRSWSQDDPDLIKKIHFWSDSSQDFVNPSGIDAPFKKLYDNNFIWADTNPNDEAKFGASTICGSLLKERDCKIFCVSGCLSY